uniref:RNA-directed DNA polymerase n=1 Tax=Meloidogyne enterolobii TaxID=390850 RepID=A0A6V7WXT1_MELEN|nr:unnamed protein product [Meloidogyne enterolobii]
MFLDGIPRQVLEELPPEDKNTLTKAIESLKRSLDTPIRAQLAKQSLSLCRQKEDESIDRFVDRLVPLIFAAYPEQNPQSRKDILKAAFLDKIKEEIAFYVRVGITPQQSFEEVRIKALEVENLIQTRKRKHENEEWLSAISQINQKAPPRFPSGNFSTWQNDTDKNRKTVGFSDSLNRNYSPPPRSPSYSRYQGQPRNNNFSYRNYFNQNTPRGNTQPNSLARNFNQPRNFNQSFGRQPNMNNIKICNYCHKAGHLISECYTRSRNYGPYQNTIRAHNPNFQQPFRNASYPRNQNNYTSQYNSGRINTLDVHNLPNHFNNLDINHGPHNIKTLSINEQPEIKPNASNPTNYPTELNKPEEINRASEIERWEPPLSKSNYSIAPFITRLSTIFLLILIIPGYFAYPQIPANLNYKPNSPMVCQTEQRGEYWSLPEFAPCPRIKPNLTGSPVPQNIRLYRLNAFKQNNQAWACRIIRKQENEYTNPMNDLITKNILPTNLYVPPLTCQKMILDKRCEFGTLKEESGLWHTDNRLYYEKRFPIVGWSWRSHSSLNCYVFKTEISVPHTSETIQSSLGNMNHCRYTEGNCTLSDNTTLIWTPDPEKQCLYIPVGEYKGHVMANVWMGNQIELGLSLDPKSQNISDCNKTLKLTEQGFAFEVIKDNKPKRHKRSPSSFEWNWNHETLVTDSQLEGQLTYLDQEVKDSLTFQFSHSLHQLCEFAEETRKWTTTAMLTDPTTLARTIFRNPNLIARYISGNTLKIWPCIPLSPTQYKFAPTNLDTCFDLIPVILNTQGKSELSFIDPTTLIISSKARKAPCEQYRKIPIQINNTLIEIDQITGEEITLHSRILTSNSLHKIDSPKIEPHAFHHMVLVNLTDIIAHSYLTNLAEISQITYRIEQQSSGITSSFSSDWEQVRQEIIRETLGDWSNFQNNFCLVICIIASIDIIIRLSALLLENYLKKFSLIRAISARIFSSQTPSKPNPEPENKPKAEATIKHQAKFRNHPSQILLELGRPSEGQPSKWPPSATKFPLVYPPAPVPRPDANNSKNRLNRRRSHSLNVLINWSNYDFSTNHPTWVHHPLPIVNATIDSMSFDCLIDTGSTISLAPIGLAIGLLCPIIEGELIVTTPSGHNVPIIGKTIVEIIICSHSREIDLYLVPNDKFIGEGSFQIILGCNLFTQLPAMIINFEDSLLSIGEETTPLIHTNNPQPQILALTNNFYNSTITAYINNYKFSCLADTGATFTAAPISIAEKLVAPIKYEKLASCNAQICIAGHIIPIEIKFVDDKYFHNTKDYEVILGCDTFAKLPPLTFNHKENTLTIGINSTPMGIKPKFRVMGIRAFKSLSIPPESQCLVPIRTETTDDTQIFSVNILDKRLVDQDFCLIPTVIQPKNNLSIIPLINPTQEPKIIYQNMKIAFATELALDQENLLFNECPIESINSTKLTGHDTLIEVDPTFKIDFSKSSLKEPDLGLLKSLCEEFSDIFSKSQYDLGSCKAGSHNIVTTTQEPITSKPHRTPFKYRDELKKHIQQLLNSGVMVQSDTPWVSNFVLVQKKDGGLRPCIDFRKLNEITVPDYFPLPRLETIMEKIGNCHLYSSLDLSSGYLQIPLTEEASRKCGLITEEGIFQMTHLPFGLRNATAAFSRTMTHVLSGVENVLAYVDDILVYTKSPDVSDHLKTLRSVFERFRLFDLKLSPKKCKFAIDSMDFLGYTVSPKGYTPSLSRIEIIKNLSAPTTLKQVRRIVGMASFYRKHILGFATIVEPLTRLNKKNKAFEWGKDQMNAFQKIKDLLSEEPILTFPDYTSPFHIFTDASGVGHGAALMQKREEKFSAIAYASRSLSANERKWPPVQIELGAIIYALRTFRPYIYLSEVELHSDHRPLAYLQSKSHQHPQLARWLIEIQNYNIKIVHIEGKKNTLADALSRAHNSENDNTSELEDIIEFPVCLSLSIYDRTIHDPVLNTLNIRTRDGETQQIDLIKEQTNDPEIFQILKFLYDGSLPDISEEKQKDFVVNAQNLKIISDILYFQPPESVPRIYAPISLRALIFDSFHNNIVGGGHMNLRKTLNKCSRRYYWPKMYSDILMWTKQCLVCQLRHNPIPLYRTEMRSVPANTLFARIGLDLAGPLPLTESGNKHILNIICWFSKYVIAVPVPNTKSQTIAHALFKNVYLKFGGCTELITDNATTFTSEFFRSFCSLLYINKTYSTPYYSQGNSVTERSFRTFHNILAKYINPKEPNFDEFLDAAAFCYNTSIHETTKETPFFLVFGRDPIFSIDQILDSTIYMPLPENDLSEFKTKLILSLRKAWNLAAEATKQAQQKSKTQYDKKSRSQIIAIGDRVLLRNYTGKIGTSQKFHLPWKGLFRVIESDGIHATILSCSAPQSKPHKVHLNQIKKFIGPEITTPALTTNETPLEELEALKQSQAEELTEVVGYNHELNDNTNKNKSTESEQITKSQNQQVTEKLLPDNINSNTHQYNLRSRKQ